MRFSVGGGAFQWRLSPDPAVSNPAWEEQGGSEAQAFSSGAFDVSEYVGYAAPGQVKVALTQTRFNGRLSVKTPGRDTLSVEALCESGAILAFEQLLRDFAASFTETHGLKLLSIERALSTHKPWVEIDLSHTVPALQDSALIAAGWAAMDMEAMGVVG